MSYTIEYENNRIKAYFNQMLLSLVLKISIYFGFFTGARKFMKAIDCTKYGSPEKLRLKKVVELTPKNDDLVDKMFVTL